MEYNLFRQQVLERLSDNLGDKLEVKIDQIRKNNGIVLDAILVSNDNETALPCIYLDPYYEKCVRGKDINAIVTEIINLYNEAAIQAKKIDIERMNLCCFDTVKERVFVKLVNAEMNEELLITIPHRRYLDMAVIYCILCNEEEEEISSITLSNKILEHWNCTLDELYDVAIRNTEELFPVQIRSMNDIMFEMTGGNLASSIEEDTSPIMYVISNLKQINGASSILYPSVKDKIVDCIGVSIERIIILPSSIHECILIPVVAEYDCRQLKNMVREVNRTQVMKHEVLSDEVYCWSVDQNRIIYLD